MASDSLELFSLSFLKTLINENQEENIFYSPLSIMTAFSMLLLGTKNESAKQICQALKLEKSSAEIHSSVVDLIEKCIVPLNPHDATVLSIANGLFMQKNFKIHNEYKSDLQKHYKTELKEVDFEDRAVAKQINQWIEDKTKNKIKDMFDENAFDHMTKLVLANAVYFKGSFKNNFIAEQTHEKDFHTNANKKLVVKMMQIVDDHNYTEDLKLGIRMVEIPFQNYKFKLLLCLPTERFGLDKALTKLKEKELTHMISSLGLRRFSTLQVPKFKIDTQMDLKKLMNLLGVKDIFDREKANLKGIADEQLWVEKAVHKTFLDVNEYGVEAAAVTAMQICLMCMPFYADETPVEFIADEPFLIVLYNVDAKAIVFIGIINKP